jgi:hypothetical protein
VNGLYLCSVAWNETVVERGLEDEESEDHRLETDATIQTILMYQNLKDHRLAADATRVLFPDALFQFPDAEGREEERFGSGQGTGCGHGVFAGMTV